MKILNAPQQGFAAMQNKGKREKGMFGDVLLDALQQPMQHVDAHQLWLVINGCVAKPVTIGAVYVASRCNLDQQLRDGLIMKGGNIWIVGPHADTRWV